MAFVEVTKKDHIAVVTMNRPEALNALNKAVFTDLEVALDDVEKDDEVYVVIITGAGRAFIAGADIGEMAPMNVAEGLAFSELGNRILMRVDMMEKPTIAAVNGFALGGGCELSMACDIRICADTAVFGQPETGLGITPGFGGTQRLARLVGPGMAKQLIYTAKNIKADEAYRIGLVNPSIPWTSCCPPPRSWPRPSPRTRLSPSAPASRPSTTVFRWTWTRPSSSRKSSSAAASSLPTRSRVCPPSWRSASTSPIRTSKLIGRHTA